MNILGNRRHGGAIARWALGLVLLASTSPTLANQDPAACQGSGINLQLFVQYNDGTDATGATFTECETIKYFARLCHSGGTLCNFEGNANTTWTITTPDGVDHDVMPVGGIPLISNNGVCKDSETVTYQITGAGVQSADTDARTVTSHTGDPDTLSNAGTGIGNNTAPCGAGTPCADKVCDPAFQFTSGLISRLGGCADLPEQLSTSCEADGNLCTVDHCDGNGACVKQSDVTCDGPTGFCDGGEVCNPETGLCVDLPDRAVSTTCQADATACTIDHCDGNGACVKQSDVQCAGPTGVCDGGEVCNPETGQCDDLPDAEVSTDCTTDSDPCTIEHCDGAGACVFEASDPACQAICRTPGYWGTHGAVTQAVINSAPDDCLEVCGEVIKNTTVASADSALEAICVSPQGDQKLQLMRQLTSMALNCVVSSFGATCGPSGSGLGYLFTQCSNACRGAASDLTVGDCIAAVDCFNNGGHYDDVEGLCTFDEDNCHERALPASLPLGAADSPQTCNQARKNTCGVIPDYEQSTGVTGCTAAGNETNPGVETCN
jgi:hypothetical protein